MLTLLQCEHLLASFLQARQLQLISLLLRNYTIRKVLRTRYQVSWLCSVRTSILRDICLHVLTALFRCSHAYLVDVSIGWGEITVGDQLMII